MCSSDLDRLGEHGRDARQGIPSQGAVRLDRGKTGRSNRRPCRHARMGADRDGSGTLADGSQRVSCACRDSRSACRSLAGRTICRFACYRTSRRPLLSHASRLARTLARRKRSLLAPRSRSSVTSRRCRCWARPIGDARARCHPALSGAARTNPTEIIGSIEEALRRAPGSEMRLARGSSRMPAMCLARDR